MTGSHPGQQPRIGTHVARPGLLIADGDGAEQAADERQPSQRIEEGRANAKAAGVEHLGELRLQDALEADLSDATVVTLYLLSSSNVKLRPRLPQQLKAGARIVSHQFGMGDWEPAKVETFTDGKGTSRTLYLWTADGTAREDG